MISGEENRALTAHFTLQSGIFATVGLGVSGSHDMPLFHGPVGTPARGRRQVSSTSYIATCFAPVNGSSFDFVSFRVIIYFLSHPSTSVHS